ncbi:helix-turn-helix domain-containing protein [Desulfitobacterium chlororespirans]|uniref:Transcriptional regulator, XRE family with cupin sensor n=1 Tax=Desulfitobacterium chlororespirans DSM 11544 TaxID=1121395 RepID=A0A1M7UW43_9FIRM|nr:XRE family transcriptional regulator [Desulfitobacterium chlororespirans]SHN87137.1 transcriptional regulator, XRE family with cupin sensor [Desulfitobacterium chlororespirans DSM 11544]
MKDLNQIVANNLKRIREEMKLSLDKVADLTGVSKGMLRQIEAGESSPTIKTIWKIASGLKIPYTSIINIPQPETFLVLREEIEPQVEDDGRYKVYSIFPSEDGRKVEVYTIELEKDGSFASNSHGEKTQEFITVYEGVLTIQVDDEEYSVKAGDSIKFMADRAHAYSNRTEHLTRASMVIYYPM